MENDSRQTESYPLFAGLSQIDKSVSWIPQFEEKNADTHRQHLSAKI
jgi:hypothetical protein